MGLAVLGRTALALSAAALLVAATAQPVAAAPPTLTGQSVDDQYVLTYPYSTNRVSCRENADGTVRFAYSFSGGTDATEPYPGDWSEEGEIHLGTPGEFGGREVVSFNSTFTFDSAVGQVSGTKRLAASPSNHADGGCQFQSFPHIDSAISYSATIVSPEGVFSDRGRGRTDISQFRAEQPQFWYQAYYTSDLAAPEQQGSVLLGKRTPGASSSKMSANAKRAVAFPLYFPATVRKLHAFVDGQGAGSGSQTLRGVLYGNGPGNAPGALLGRTFQFSVPAGMSGRWLELYLAPAIRLNPGVYWLGLHSGATGGVARFAWDPRDNSRRFNVDFFPDGPSNPFGSAALDNQQMSIFVSGSY
jgi:hypothetical protein